MKNTFVSFPKSAEIFTPIRMMEEKMVKKEAVETQKQFLMYAIVPAESIPTSVENPITILREETKALDILKLKMARKALTAMAA